MQKSKAFFLDRDGVIIRNLEYLNNTDNIEFLHGAESAIRKIGTAGYKCIVVTNQSGIARGLLSEETLLHIHSYIASFLKQGGAIINDFYFCPHHPEGKLRAYRKVCSCRKPEAGLILKAAQDHNIDLSESVMIGDQDIDLLAGRKAGCKSYILNKPMDFGNEQIIFNSLEKVVDYALSHASKNQDN